MQNTFIFKWNFLIFGLHCTKIQSLKRAFTQHYHRRSDIDDWPFSLSLVVSMTEKSNAKHLNENWIPSKHWLNFIFKVKITWIIWKESHGTNFINEPYSQARFHCYRKLHFTNVWNMLSASAQEAQWVKSQEFFEWDSSKGFLSVIEKLPVFYNKKN